MVVMTHHRPGMPGHPTVLVWAVHGEEDDALVSEAVEFHVQAPSRQDATFLAALYMRPPVGAAPMSRLAPKRTWTAELVYRGVWEESPVEYIPLTRQAWTYRHTSSDSLDRMGVTRLVSNERVAETTKRRTPKGV